MRGAPRDSKVIFALTAAFLTLMLGRFLVQSSRPYQVDVQRPAWDHAASGTGSVPGAGRPDSLLEGERININTAGVDELCRLPGIGERRAQAIVDWRASNGPFRTPGELTQVWGIGDGIFSGMVDYITVG